MPTSPDHVDEGRPRSAVTMRLPGVHPSGPIPVDVAAALLSLGRGDLHGGPAMQVLVALAARASERDLGGITLHMLLGEPDVNDLDAVERAVARLAAAHDADDVNLHDAL